MEMLADLPSREVLISRLLGSMMSPVSGLAIVLDQIAKKNESQPDLPYTMFHVIVAALVKTLTLRPKMNRFIANTNFYQRNEVSASFVVKKQFADNAAEALADVAHLQDVVRRHLHASGSGVEGGRGGRRRRARRGAS